jgi:enterochelin esterase-like enzyme
VINQQILTKKNYERKPMKLKMMMLLSLLAFGTANHAAAQKVDVAALTPVEQVMIKSKQLSNGMTFNVTLPPGYKENADKRYFVLLDFHPRSQPYLSGLHDWLSHNGEWPWPETLIVTPGENSKAFAAVFESMNGDEAGVPLLDFMEHDLLATIDKKYRTNGFRIINGFRGNGTLSLFTLFNRPELFNAYIVASPNLAGDYAKLMSSAAKNIAKLTDKPRFLSLSTGTHRYEQGDLASFEQLEQILAANAPKQLDWQARKFSDQYFMSQPVIAALTGIEALFDDIHNDLTPDSDISQQGPQAIIDYYQYVSTQKYGFEVSAEGSLTALGESYLASSPKKALQIFELLVKTYPESAYAIHALAHGHATMGQLTKAVTLQTSAVEKAKTLGEWHVNKHKSHLEKYQTALATAGKKGL